MVGLRVFAAQRVFEKERIVLLQLAAESDGIGRVETGVIVDDDLDLWADFLAHGGKVGDAIAHGRTRL